MSISRMASRAVVERVGPVKHSLEALDPDTTKDASATSKYLDAVVEYIPTEVITLYVAVVTVVEKVGEGERALTPMWVFYAFLAATPVIAWLVFAGKYKAKKKELPLPLNTWPWWTMFAATLAYAAWALALPDSVSEGEGWYNAGIAALGLVLVSMLLGLLAPILKPEPAPAAGGGGA